jgi:hypothetical protein
MKKIMISVLALTLAASAAYAEKSDVQAPAAPSAAQTEKLAAMRKLIADKKQELNGSEWLVDVSTNEKKLGQDTLTFQNNQITCKTLSDKGYPATNYTVSLPEGSEFATWETMQTSSSGAVMFMRGEWKEGLMRGVMSEQMAEGKNQDFNFASVSKVAVPPTVEKKEEPKKEEPKKDELKAEETPVVAEPISPEAIPGADALVPAEAKPVVAPFSPGTTEEEIVPKVTKAAKKKWY